MNWFHIPQRTPLLLSSFPLFKSLLRDLEINDSELLIPSGTSVACSSPLHLSPDGSVWLRSQAPSREGVWLKEEHQQTAALKDLLLPSVWKANTQTFYAQKSHGNCNDMQKKPQKPNTTTLPALFQSVIKKSAVLTFPPVAVTLH